MALSDEDSENLRRIADALDPPSYGGSSGGGPPLPLPVRAILGGVISALVVAIPIDLFVEITSLFIAVIGFGVWLGTLLK
jgi:hypothetical protein